MGYYMRYFITESKEIRLPDLIEALKEYDQNYSADDIKLEPKESCILKYKKGIYAQLDIVRKSDFTFEDDLGEFLEEIQNIDISRIRKTKLLPGPQDKKDEVLQELSNTSAILTVQVLWQGRSLEKTLEKIDPIWALCFANYKGLMQADGEGFYSKEGLLILRLE